MGSHEMLFIRQSCSNSEDDKQISRARSEAAANKKKREAKKQKDKKKQF